ncbi:hypothetical protein TrLO_g8656, partial [Triparma laevis f. longispina]
TNPHLLNNPPPPNQDTTHLLKALDHGRQNEEDLNATYMSKAIGNEVKYGEQIQLRHQKSGKYVCVNTTQTATTERENLVVVLDSAGSALSWLTVMPRLKIDQEGDIVRNASDVYFKVHERTNEYLHCSEKTIVDTDDKEKEVNCSLEKTAWKLLIFDHASVEEEHNLRCNDIVFLMDPEAKGYLRLPAPVSNTGETDFMSGGKGRRQSVHAVQEGAKVAKQSRDAFMEPFFDPRAVDSNCMWLVEKKIPTQGGKLVYEEEQEYKFVSSDDTDSGNTLFCMHSAHHRSANQENCVHDISAMFLESSNARYLKRGDYNYDRVEGKAVFDVNGVPKKNDGLAMIISKVPPAQRDDVAYGMDSLPILVEFKRNFMSRDWNNVGKGYAEVLSVMNKMTNFCINRPLEEELSYATSDLAHLQSSSVQVEMMKEIVRARQKLFREQNILDCCMQLLRTFAQVRDDMSAHTLKITREHEKLCRSVIENVGKACFWLIFCSMYENDKNQMHIANNLAIILRHVSTSTLATRCVVEMLGSNMELQEEKVTAKEIKIFVSMISKSKMNANYLNLLRATCNCNGEGVDGNQGLVVELFMQKKANLTIQLLTDTVERKECQWKEVPAFEADASTDGFELKEKGIPAITVKWHETFKDFSPIHLYAKSVVPLKEVVEILGDDEIVEAVRKKGGNAADMIEEATRSNGDSSAPPVRGARSSIRGMRPTQGNRNFRKTGKQGTFGTSAGDLSMIQLRKLMVAEYFVSQIYLFAETCLDRNYISMQHLEEQLPYSMLLSIVRDDLLPDEFRAAVTRLMNCLYVDAYPQNMVRLPTLTRIWSKIDPDAPTPLPAVEASRDKKFAFLQEAITEHLESLIDGAEWNIFTRRLMESLMLLVKFRFYTTSAQVQYIVNPLLKSLDRRGSTEHLDAVSDLVSHLGSPFKRKGTIRGGAAKISPEKDMAKAELPWEAPVLKLMSGTPWMLGVLALVFFCLGTSGYQMSLPEEEALEHKTAFDVIEYFTFSLFAIELILRMYCWKKVKRKMKTFFADKYHNLDVAVVALDVVIIFITEVVASLMEGSSVGGFTKILRVARAAKLFRILRAARLVNEMTKAPDALYPKWTLSKRYSVTPEDQLSTMVEMVKALSEITRLSEDFAVSKMMNSFKLWHKGELEISPSEIFTNVIESSKELELDSTGDLEHVFIDLCYYDYPDLVQNSLQVLMVHHSTRQILLNNIRQVQLLTTTGQEDLHDRLLRKLKLLEEHAEKSELWIEFENPRDFEICEEVQQILAELTDEIKTDSEDLEYGGDESANEDIQNVLRNLGAFEVAATVLELAGELDDDDDDEEEEEEEEGSDEEGGESGGDEASVGSGLERTKSEKVHSILLLCNTFLTWFVRDNPENQMLAFRNLDLLQETIDDEIDSTRVIAQIFRKNEDLMKEFPEHLVTEFAEKIATNGRKPDYLDLIESIVSFADYNQLSHQYIIIKEFTSSVRAEKILYLCQDPVSPEYAERQKMMAIRGGASAMLPPAEDLEDEEAENHAKEMFAEAGQCPSLLRYHCMMLNIMAGCAVGRANITTVEAKLQSLYQYEFIMKAIADPTTHIEVKIGLMNLFYEAYIEVEIKIPGLSEGMEFWDCIKTLIEPPKVMAQALLTGDVGLSDMRKMMHFVFLSAKCVDGFLECYYEGTEFRTDDGNPGTVNEGDEEDGEKDATEMHWIDKVFFDLYNSFKELYDLKSPMVTDEQYTVLYRVMDSLSMSTDALASVELPMHIDVVLGDREVEEDVSSRKDEVSSLARFVKALEADEDLEEEINEDRTDHLVTLIDKLPRIADDVDAEIRYEPTIKKLVTHTRNLIKKDKQKKFIPRDCVETVIWTIQLFRAMIETKWTESFQDREGKDAGKMGIDERDEDGEEEEDEAAGPVQDTLDECGATILCLDVIADGMNEKVVEEGVNLLVALMFREGGNKKVQRTIFEHLNQRGTDHFFEEIRNRLKKMMEWHQNKVIDQEDEAKEKMRMSMGKDTSQDSANGEEELEEGEDVMAKRQKTTMTGMKSKKWSEDGFKATVEKVHENGTVDVKYLADGHVAKRVPVDMVEKEEEEVEQPDGIILIRAIQLMSEGHFEQNQDICRDQPNNIRSINLLDDFVNYLSFLSKNPSNESTEAAIAVAGTILEVIQGPCVQNQKHFAMSTELIEILNRMMRIKGGDDADEESEDELKKTGLEIFQALLEGQSKGSEIYERILSVIHLDVLQIMACAGAGEDTGGGGEEDEDEVEGDEDKSDEEEEEEDEGMGEVQTEALVLMQMLCDYRPSLREEIVYPPEIEAIIGKDVVSVEVIWNSVLQRRFFPIPEMCHDLADASKNKFVEEVDRDTQETKLTGLMQEAKVLYIEIKHQQILKDNGLASVFSRSNQERATWISFFFAMLINLLLVSFYQWKEPAMSPDVLDGDGMYLGAYPNVYLAIQADNAEYEEGTQFDAMCTTRPCEDKMGRYEREFYEATNSTEQLEPKLGGSDSEEAMVKGFTLALNVCQCATAIFVFVLFLVVRCPVRYEVGIQHMEMSDVGALIYTATDSMTLYYLGYVIVAIMCLSNNMYCCILLLDIIVKDSTTRDVLNAVIYPIKQLSMTLVLLVITVNIFQTVLFYNFHTEFDVGDLMSCGTMADCFVMTLNYGLRSSGGIGDMMTKSYSRQGNRWVVDLLYFLLVLIVLLNVVFGIIIDTFSDLRLQKMERLSDTFNKCFICGHEKTTFDRAYDSPKGFEMHIKRDHNMWNYVFFMIFVWEQDRDDDDGLELFVRLQVDNMDVSWFPMNRAICLVTETVEEDTVSDKIEALSGEFEGLIAGQNAIMMKSNDKHFGYIERNVKVIEKSLYTFKAQNLFNSNFSFIGRGGVATPQGDVSVPRKPMDGVEPPSANSGSKARFVEGVIGGDSGSLGGDGDDASLDSTGRQEKRITMLLSPPPGSRYAKVAVLGASDLAAPHLFGTSDPFIVAQVFWNDDKVGETDTIWMSQTPKWENTKTNSFQCPLWATENQNAKMAKLKVCLYHAHRRGLGHFLGQIELTWSELNSAKNGKAKFYRLQKRGGANKASQRMVQGEIRVAVAFSTEPAPKK